MALVMRARLPLEKVFNRRKYVAIAQSFHVTQQVGGKTAARRSTRVAKLHICPPRNSCVIAFLGTTTEYLYSGPPLSHVPQCRASPRTSQPKRCRSLATLDHFIEELRYALGTSEKAVEATHEAAKFPSNLTDRHPPYTAR